MNNEMTKLMAVMADSIGITPEKLVTRKEKRKNRVKAKLSKLKKVN